MDSGRSVHPSSRKAEIYLAVLLDHLHRGRVYFDILVGTDALYIGALWSIRHPHSDPKSISGQHSTC